MKVKYSILLSLFTVLTFAQNLKSPSEFFGYELGTRFARHHQVVDYYSYLAKAAKDRVQLVNYGESNEHRKLILAYISSADNMKNLEAIRKEHLKALDGNGEASKAIIWLSYNVHGNESVATESSLQTIYELLTSKSSYLDNTIVIIDPCLNPDGRDRYVNWYNQYKSTPFQIDPNSVEHHQGWWTGRSNHYMFDLNRDWAWLTQIESQLRLKQYNKWFPHIHVDFHEQGVDEPYYFAPAAEPYHEVITKFQRDFQTDIGKNNASYFDKNGWFYFSKERFDLLYPSYGDTYPTYNGSIGMTYEQGGSGRAGLGIITKIGDTLTLKDRIAHHHTAGISTVEMAHKNAAKLNDEFRKYFRNKNFKYKNYVLNGNNDHLSALKKLLDAHEIEYSQGTSTTVKGYRYQTGAAGSLAASNEALVVSTNQKKGTLVKVLFEPKTKLSDSLTYDITAWSLPYAYGLNAVATSAEVNAKSSKTQTKTVNLTDSYAYVTDWDSMNDARFLAELLNNKIKVRAAYHPFTINGKQFKRGSLIITKADNKFHSNFLSILNRVANKFQKEITPTSTGFVDSGKDFGSDDVKMISAPKIAVLAGEPTSTLRYGEVWHFFEQQLQYPFTAIKSDYADQVDFSDYDVLILPDGRNYGDFFDDESSSELKYWVKNGGNLIVMGNAIKSLAESDKFSVKQKSIETENGDVQLNRYEGTQRNYIQNAITGAIFKVKVDNTNPLAYGYKNNYFTLKLGSNAFDYLDKGTVAYLEENTKPFSGFAGSKAQEKIKNSLVFGVEKAGKGNVIYLVDNPLFRGFWENGKLFFANALFMIP